MSVSPLTSFTTLGSEHLTSPRASATWASTGRESPSPTGPGTKIAGICWTIPQTKRPSCCGRNFANLLKGRTSVFHPITLGEIYGRGGRSAVRWFARADNWPRLESDRGRDSACRSFSPLNHYRPAGSPVTVSVAMRTPIDKSKTGPTTSSTMIARVNLSSAPNTLKSSTSG